MKKYIILEELLLCIIIKYFNNYFFIFNFLNIKNKSKFKSFLQNKKILPPSCVIRHLSL